MVPHVQRTIGRALQDVLEPAGALRQRCRFINSRGSALVLPSRLRLTPRKPEWQLIVSDYVDWGRVMSSRFGFTSSRLCLLGVLAVAVGLGGCAKRYHGSLKDDAPTAHAKPVRVAHRQLA